MPAITTRDGVEIFYKDWGSGQPIVFSHGLEAPCETSWPALLACCHTFRATGITTYLENGGTLEHAQTIANHESPRTTKLYDRTREELTAEEIGRIRI